VAKKYVGSPLTTLSHHMDSLWLREAYGKVRRDSAPGVDGQTVAAYGENLEANLKSLLERAKNGTYRAPPVKRVHLPKSATETRPIGQPTVEDKVLNRAVVMLLAGLPKYLPQGAAQQVLAHCDQTTVTGRRNYAILLLLARLGLRGGEVVDVRLEDIDWRRGEITVRSKSIMWN
jgi:integrase